MQNEQLHNVLFRVCTMEANRVQLIQEALWECARYLGTTLEAVQLRAYASELLEDGIDPHDAVFAIQQIRKQPNRKRWGVPLPAEIMQFLRPRASEDDEANSVAAKIQACYRLFGYSNPGKAESHMGPTAWQVVQESGGWVQMCAGSSEEAKHTERAQLRDLARSVIRRGVHDERTAQLAAHRVSRSALLCEPKPTREQLAQNKRRVSDLIGSVFSSDATDKVS